MSTSTDAANKENVTQRPNGEAGKEQEALLTDCERHRGSTSVDPQHTRHPLRNSTGARDRPAMFGATHESIDDLLSAVNVRLSRLISPVLFVTVVAITAFLVTFFLTSVVPYYVSIGWPHMAAVMSLCAVLYGYAVLYFYFKAALTKPGFAPTVQQLVQRGYNVVVSPQPSQQQQQQQQQKTETNTEVQKPPRVLKICPHCLCFKLGNNKQQGTRHNHANKANRQGGESAALAPLQDMRPVCAEDGPPLRFVKAPTKASTKQEGTPKTTHV